MSNTDTRDFERHATPLPNLPRRGFLGQAGAGVVGLAGGTLLAKHAAV